MSTFCRQVASFVKISTWRYVERYFVIEGNGMCTVCACNTRGLYHQWSTKYYWTGLLYRCSKCDCVCCLTVIKCHMWGVTSAWLACCCVCAVQSPRLSCSCVCSWLLTVISVGCTESPTCLFLCVQCTESWSVPHVGCTETLTCLFLCVCCLTLWSVCASYVGA